MDVRFFKKSEKQLLTDSIDRLWRKDHIYSRNPAVLEHLTLNTPYRAAFAGEDNYSFVGMWDGDEVIGLQGFIPQKANVLGKSCPALAGTVWFVKKEPGRTADGLDMLRFVLNEHPEIALRYGLGLSVYSYKIHKLLGGQMIDDLPRWVGVVQARETAEILLEKKIDERLLPVIEPVKLETKLAVLPDYFDGNAWDSFYQEFSKHYIGLCRDAEFLRWRYMESPVLRYHFISVLDTDHSYRGLAVLRIEDIAGGHQIGRILEFIAMDIEASVTLANAIAEYSKTVLMWDFYCMTDLTAYGLEKIGFRKSPIWTDDLLMPTRFQPIDHKMLRLNGYINLGKPLQKATKHMASVPWYLTRGDSDQDRAN